MQWVSVMDLDEVNASLPVRTKKKRRFFLALAVNNRNSPFEAGWNMRRKPDSGRRERRCRASGVALPTAGRPTPPILLLQ